MFQKAFRHKLEFNVFEKKDFFLRILKKNRNIGKDGVSPNA